MARAIELDVKLQNLAKGTFGTSTMTKEQLLIGG
jgi:hypothetical protein